jgi:aminoglycoside 3'-phosphotransferase II
MSAFGAKHVNQADLVLPRRFLSRLPQSWQDDLCRFDASPIERGMSEAHLFRLREKTGTELYLKIVERVELSALHNEVQRTRWLTQRGIRAPDIIRVFDDGSISAALMTAVPGHHPGEIGRPMENVVPALAKGLLGLHSLCPSECPFDETVNARLSRARQLIEAGAISAEAFADRNRGLVPEAIYTRLIQTIPEHEDLVVVHGDATFDNLLIDDDGKVGFVDCGHAGRGDRYLDLATIASDLEKYFGLSGVDLFLRSYGFLDLDAGKLDFFRDLYELF